MPIFLRGSDDRSSQYFETADEVITAGGLLTIPHDLGVEPLDVIPILVCAVASNGYSIGDKVRHGFMTSSDQNNTSHACAIWADDTNIYIKFGTQASTFLLHGKTTGTVSAMTNSSWRIKARAFL